VQPSGSEDLAEKKMEIRKKEIERRKRRKG
jgi:hypothetical protein